MQVLWNMSEFQCKQYGNWTVHITSKEEWRREDICSECLLVILAMNWVWTYRKAVKALWSHEVKPELAGQQFPWASYLITLREKRENFQTCGIDVLRKSNSWKAVRKGPRTSPHSPPYQCFQSSFSNLKSLLKLFSMIKFFLWILPLVVLTTYKKSSLGPFYFSTRLDFDHQLQAIILFTHSVRETEFIWK